MNTNNGEEESVNNGETPKKENTEHKQAEENNTHEAYKHAESAEAHMRIIKRENMQ